ncbi:MAG: RtcB family protein, partial [Myxococcota bacterium]
MYEVISTDSQPIKAWIKGVTMDDLARKQLTNAAQLPFIHKWIAAMPDVHAGLGATIGSVIPTDRAIIPAAVGVDIGCGMMATQTSLRASDLPDSLKPLRSAIERAVPHGRTNGGARNDRGAWHDLPSAHADVWTGLAPRYKEICDKHPTLNRGSSANHLGTLGTGNHFIEVCLDEADRVWVMLHSGSRGVGNRIGRYFIERAKQEMQRFFVKLDDIDLAYLPQGSQYFDDYVAAVGWAQDFAMANRQLMMRSVLETMAGLDALPTIAPAAQVVEDYAASGLSLKAHPVSFLREQLDADGVVTC